MNFENKHRLSLQRQYKNTSVAWDESNTLFSRQKAKYFLDEVLGQEPGTAWGMEVSVVAV